MRKDFRILGPRSHRYLRSMFLFWGSRARISRAVDPTSAMPPLGDPNRRSLTATNSMKLSREQGSTCPGGRIGARALGRRATRPAERIPATDTVTRLYSAQRAFFEIGAREVVHVLRCGLFSLKRPKPLSQVVAEMTVILVARTKDVEHLVAIYTELELTRPDSPPGVRGQPSRRLA